MNLFKALSTLSKKIFRFSPDNEALIETYLGLPVKLSARGTAGILLDLSFASAHPRGYRIENVLVIKSNGRMLSPLRDTARRIGDCIVVGLVYTLTTCISSTNNLHNSHGLFSKEGQRGQN